MVRRPVDTHRVLSCESRVAILRLLEERDRPTGVEEVSQAVGLHVNTVREHLDRMVAAGFLERQPEVRTTRGRPRMLYRSVVQESEGEHDRRVRDQLTRLLLAAYGRGATDLHRAAAEDGERWAATYPCPTAGRDDGTPQSQVAALEDHFDALSFAPVVEVAVGDHREPLPGASSAVVRLRRCPFADLVGAHGDVVCAVHLGLARGMLARHEGPLTADRIVRTEAGCTLVLRERDAAAPEVAAVGTA